VTSLLVSQKQSFFSLSVPLKSGRFLGNIVSGSQQYSQVWLSVVVLDGAFVFFVLGAVKSTILSLAVEGISYNAQTTKH
jgi:hypothetical protein